MYYYFFIELLTPKVDLRYCALNIDKFNIGLSCNILGTERLKYFIIDKVIIDNLSIVFFFFLCKTLCRSILNIIGIM